MKTFDQYFSRSATVADIARWAAKSQPEHVRVVVKELESVARNKSTTLKAEPDRVRFARIAVGLLPSTLGLIKALLGNRRSELDYEVHFSLFCYLDHVLSLKALSGFSPILLRAVVEYLCVADPGEAEAVWMATDLLSDHWSADEGASALLEVYGRPRLRTKTRELLRDALTRCLKRRGISGLVKQRVKEAVSEKL